LIERHHERDDRTDVGRTKLMLRDKRGKGNDVTDAEMIINATPTLCRRKFADAARRRSRPPIVQPSRVRPKTADVVTIVTAAAAPFSPSNGDIRISKCVSSPT
jgi:hypothetical protein